MPGIFIGLHTLLSFYKDIFIPRFIDEEKGLKKRNPVQDHKDKPS